MKQALKFKYVKSKYEELLLILETETLIKKTEQGSDEFDLDRFMKLYVKCLEKMEAKGCTFFKPKTMYRFKIITNEFEMQATIIEDRIIFNLTTKDSYYEPHNTTIAELFDNISLNQLASNLIYQFDFDEDTAECYIRMKYKELGITAITV